MCRESRTMSSWNQGCSFHQCWLPFVSRVACHSRHTEHPSLVTNELRMCFEQVHNLRQNVTSHSLALMFLGHLCRALFRPHSFVPAFIRRAFQCLAFVCFGNGYKYLPPQFSLQASVISCFSEFLSQNYVRNVIFIIYLRLLILLCLSLYWRYNAIVNIVSKAANPYWKPKIRKL